MVADQEWFSGRAVDEHDPIVIYRPLFWIALLAVGLLLIPGCASLKDNDVSVCYMKLMGQTEGGYTVVAERCVTPEQFDAEQK